MGTEPWFALGAEKDILKAVQSILEICKGPSGWVEICEKPIEQVKLFQKQGIIGVPEEERKG